MSQESTSLSVGIYRHYKNKYYLVLYVARHTELNEDMVIYQSLYDDGRIWCRPFTMFVGDVDYNGVVQPRFKKVAESDEAEKYMDNKLLFIREESY